MSPQTVYISTVCPNGTCNPNQAITFSPTQFGYSFACANHTFSWTFGDTTNNTAQTNSATSVQHTYSAGGTYDVTMTVNNGGQTFTAYSTVTISGAPPPPACPTMTTNNVYYQYTGAKSGCVTGGNCSTDEAITFTPTQFGYSFGCANHSFSWNFGDPGANNTAVTTSPAPVSHTYSGAGNYIVTMTVANSGQTYVFTNNVRITGSDRGATQQPCSPTQVCLNTNGRYSVTLTAVDPKSSAAGPASAVGQAGPFGFFSFPLITGDAGNPEVFVKVVEPTPGNPWVFYAGLTNLDYTLTVRDTVGTFNKQYRVPSRAGSAVAVGDFDVSGNKSSSCDPVTVFANATSPGTCVTNSTSLCLLDRFRVTLFAEDNPTRTANNGVGSTLPGNSKYGFFSVPALANASDIQAFVKMVAGQAYNGHFWVFLGGLTDFKLTFTVTDTQTGMQKIYIKPVGSTCGWNDITAF